MAFWREEEASGGKPDATARLFAANGTRKSTAIETAHNSLCPRCTIS
jgi:hypothetical protein